MHTRVCYRPDTTSSPNSPLLNFCLTNSYSATSTSVILCFLRDTRDTNTLSHLVKSYPTMFRSIASVTAAARARGAAVRQHFKKSANKQFMPLPSVVVPVSRDISTAAVLTKG